MLGVSLWSSEGLPVLVGQNEVLLAGEGFNNNNNMAVMICLFGPFLNQQNIFKQKDLKRVFHVIYNDHISFIIHIN